MQREAARECVGTGWGMAQMASTVNERGQVSSLSSWSFRRPAGDGERMYGEGEGA